MLRRNNCIPRILAFGITNHSAKPTEIADLCIYLFGNCILCIKPGNFALAKRPADPHKEQAFQASSPKLPKASLRAGHFFARKPYSLSNTDPMRGANSRSYVFSRLVSVIAAT